MNLVVDCSFIISSFLPDEKQRKIETIYNKIASNIYRVYVPSIFYLECNNVLISSLKKHRISKSDYKDYIQLLSKLPISIDKFCCTTESIYNIGKLAIMYNLTSYDASYLELAIRLEAKLATLDKNLSISCSKASIESII